MSLINIFWGALILFGAQTITIPQGTAPRLDGYFSTEEWADALRLDMVDGGEVYLKCDAESLYVGIRGKAFGWAHVYVPVDDKIHVFHASAALGTAIYQKGQPIQPFVWEMRDTTFSQQANIQREAFYQKNLWLANVNMMGTGSIIEYKIKRDVFEKQAARLAIVYAVDAKKPGYIPTQINDDCLREDLINGNTPAHLKFSIRKWMKLKFSW